MTVSGARDLRVETAPGAAGCGQRHWQQFARGSPPAVDSHRCCRCPVPACAATGRFNDSNCPGGVFTDPTGNGAYCMLTGPYVLYLNGYNTVPIYAGMNNACPAQWPTYVRCPADNPACC